MFKPAVSQHAPQLPQPASSTGRLGRWLGVGLDLIFPRDCAFCQAPIETSGSGLLCEICRGELIDRRTACAMRIERAAE